MFTVVLMRKWIVIGLLAVVVIGVIGGVAYVFWEPKRGSIEYHKREYLEVGAPLGKWFRYAPEFVQNRYFRRQVNKFTFHREALLESGYLTNREFVLLHSSPGYVESAVVRRLYQGTNYSGFPWSGFVWFGPRSTNTVTVSAPVAAMSQLEELIREADVPKNAR